VDFVVVPVAGGVPVAPGVPVAGAPTGTIGLGGVDVLVGSELDGCVAGGAFWPSGMTMGVDCASPPPLVSLPVSASNCGGQSTEVGGQLSALPPPPDDAPGGAQPEAAPKSPAPVQSASATPAGSTAHPISERTAAAIRIRDVITA
jgi:hypothetical protein